MKKLVLIILLSITQFSLAQADWDYGDPSPSGYYATIPVDSEFGYLVGPDTFGWVMLRRELQTEQEFKTLLMRMVDALSYSDIQALKATRKKKKAH